MRRKCLWCQNVKKVKYRDAVKCNFFCSLECLKKAYHIQWIATIACARCGNAIRMNAVVVRRYNGNSDMFYCCEKCMMDDLGIFEEDKQDGT